MTKSKDPMPDRVDCYGDAPAAERMLYEEASENRSGYELSPGGCALKHIRQAKAERPHDPQPLRKKFTVTREDWGTTLAVATPNERKTLMQSVAAGKIRIKKG